MDLQFQIITYAQYFVDLLTNDKGTLLSDFQAFVAQKEVDDINQKIADLQAQLPDKEATLQKVQDNLSKVSQLKTPIQ